MIHPPLHLVENIGNPVARFGNIVVVGKCTRHVHVGAQERFDVVAVPYGILVEVARIEPPAAHVTFRRGIRAVGKQAGGLVLRVVHAVGPILARILFFLRHAYALVEHHAHRRLQDVVVDVIADAEIERLLQVIRLVTDKVSSRRIHRGEIKPPNFIARGGIDSTFLESDRCTGEHDLRSRAIHDLHHAARSVQERRIVTHLGATQHGDLLCVGAVPELVDGNEHVLREGSRREECGKRKQFDHLIQYSIGRARLRPRFYSNLERDLPQKQHPCVICFTESDKDTKRRAEARLSVSHLPPVLLPFPPNKRVPSPSRNGLGTSDPENST